MTVYNCYFYFKKRNCLRQAVYPSDNNDAVNL